MGSSNAHSAVSKFKCNRCGCDMYNAVIANDYINKDGELYCSVECMRNRHIPMSPVRCTPKELKKRNNRINK